MANVWGERIKLSIFGESHGDGIGIVIDGLPVGFEIDFEEIDREMKRRSPGQTKFSTPRKEADKVQILSGLFNGKTTGAPLCGVIQNTNTRSGDYQPELLRPGHADYTAHIKYKGFNDYRGGGHFSGRITAPLTFAGAVAKQILKQHNIFVGAHIKQIGSVKDDTFENVTVELLDQLAHNSFPVINHTASEAMQEEILQVKHDHDSVGGIVECCALGLPIGLGSPFFQSMESRIASMMFSVPAVKGIEFGEGFGFAELKGSEANDAYKIKDGKVTTGSNRNGGIIGGITNGNPLIFSVVIKPTPSIAKQQQTVNINTMEDTTITVHGRHDPCIVPRAVPVTEAALALCVLDSMAL